MDVKQKAGRHRGNTATHYRANMKVNSTPLWAASPLPEDDCGRAWKLVGLFFFSQFFMIVPTIIKARLRENDSLPNAAGCRQVPLFVLHLHCGTAAIRFSFGVCFYRLWLHCISIPSQLRQPGALRSTSESFYFATMPEHNAAAEHRADHERPQVGYRNKIKH